MSVTPLKYVEAVRSSYWFVPGCMVVLAIALALLMPWVDRQLAIDPDGSFGWLGQTQTDGARSVLVAVGGSIFGVAGTVFSITIVAVSFASGNFGPRLISNFMRDRGNQVTLGTFIATFVYCLMVLRVVHDSSSGGENSIEYAAFVPHFSVLVALGLAIASVGVLIYFIHHVPETINIDRLVADIGCRLRDGLADLFPDPDTVRHDEEDATAPMPENLGETSAVRLGGSGFVQAIDLGRLEELAAEHALIVRVQYRPGDFVASSDAVLDLRAPRTPGEGLLDELRGCFVVGRQRTEHQNALFLADQLVEVIARAMSPGVNDPLTAIACLDWAREAMTTFVERDTKQPVIERRWRDAPVRVRPIDFERLVGTLFDRTRQYVAADRDVAVHAIGVLAETAVRATREEHRRTLSSRMQALREAAGEAMSPALGADDVARRHDEALELLGDADARERRRDSADWFGGSG